MLAEKNLDEITALSLMFALHPAHSDVVFVGFPCPFLAVEHLITCHVIQLHSVQVISGSYVECAVDLEDCLDVQLLSLS